MRILLTKLSNDRHALEIVRKDGSVDRVELETKSLWLHDFLHFAVETEAGLQDGFWGSLAAGKTFAHMNDTNAPYAGTMLSIERAVGMLTGAAKGRGAEEMYEGFKTASEAMDEPVPSWLDAAFIERVQERMRRLVGHWNGTPFGETMEMEWS